MQTALKTTLGLAMAFGLVLAVAAADDKKETKETTLKGTIGCPKCVFSVAKKCGNAIKVKEKDGEVIYTFIDKGAKEEYHSKICTESAAGSVTGVVEKKKDGLFIKPAKDGVKFD